MYTDFLMDLLLIFAGRLYLRIDSFFSDWGCTHRLFPYWQELFFCAFNKDQFFPFQSLSICIFHISVPSFLGFGRLYFSDINSFLSWPSVFLQYQLLPFLAVCTSPISTPSFLGRLYFSNINSFLSWGLMAWCPFVMHVQPVAPWAEVYSATRAGKYTAVALTGLPALRWNQALAVGPSRGDAPIWAGMIPTSFFSLGRVLLGHVLTRLNLIFVYNLWWYS